MAFFERGAAKCRLPEWAFALLFLLVVDGVLAAGIVGLSMATNGKPAAQPAAKVWTEQELKDRFVLRSMDDIEGVLGTASSANVDGAGNIMALHYQDFPVVNNTGKDRVAIVFYGKGNRCTMVAVPHR